MRRCPSCGEVKPFKDCTKDRRSKDGHGRCRACQAISCARVNRARRADAMAAYGGHRCGCCGETTLEFLSIDHMPEAPRPSVTGRGAKLYIWLKRNGYPPGFQVLCHNCNLAKGFYGACPHGAA